MNSEQIKQLDNEYLLPTYARFALCLVKGKGCHAEDPEGNRYLDFTSGIGVNSLGWCDDEWVNAVSSQAAILQHTSNLYYTTPAVQLAEVLCKKTGMAKVFFANSGAEANEGAIKAARKYSEMKYGENRATILTLVNSFHGRTLATITATGQDSFHQHFHPLMPGFRYIPADDTAALAQNLTPNVCAVMLEPIQGEGGIVPLASSYLSELQKLCNEKDILIIADEVQTGVGRTGRFLACEHYGLKPDILTLAKGLGSGLPIGALLLAESCAGALSKGDHGSTFGGNPVSCAGALVVMNRLTPAFLAAAAENGAYLKQCLQNLPGVQEVSGEGLMLGITFTEPISAADILQKSIKKGLLCLLAKSKLRLLPPLIITREEIDEGISILAQALEETT